MAVIMLIGSLLTRASQQLLSRLLVLRRRCEDLRKNRRAADRRITIVPARVVIIKNLDRIDFVHENRHAIFVLCLVVSDVIGFEGIMISPDDDLDWFLSQHDTVKFKL